MRPILPSTRCSLTRHGRVRTRPGHRALGCAGSGDRPALTRVRTAAISAAAARAMEQRAFISCDWNGRPRRRARRRSACPRRRLSDAARVATDVRCASLVWNTNKRRAAWDYVRRNAESFDVALLQETHDPFSTLEDHWRSVIFRPYSRQAASRLARWGSAVIAPVLELEQYEPGADFPWLRELDGCVALARQAEAPTWFASVHAQASPVTRQILDLHPWDNVPLCTPGRTRVLSSADRQSTPRS